jgi:hypothetical protein
MSVSGKNKSKKREKKIKSYLGMHSASLEWINSPYADKKTGKRLKEL